MTNRFIFIIVAVFAVLTVLFFALNHAQPLFDLWVLMGGNSLMALLSITAYFIVKKQIGERPQAFVRGVNGAIFLKLIICAVSILAYALYNRSHIHKPTLFILFGIYITYTIVETMLLMKMAKQVK